MKRVLEDEVIFAASQSIMKNCTLVSRQSIEEHVLDNPHLYPFLRNETRKGRRNIISQVMNRHYQVWNKTEAVHPNSFVWKIRDQEEGI